MPRPKRRARWEGISFADATDDAESVLEHCAIEYGGQSTNANVYLENAAPTIQYNTIRHSSHSGIYVTGTGSNGATIGCNNLTEKRSDCIVCKIFRQFFYHQKLRIDNNLCGISKSSVEIIYKIPVFNGYLTGTCLL